MNGNRYTYAYISAGLIAAGVTALGLTFTVLGVYALIASVLLSLAAITFANVQKKKNNFKQLVIIRVAAYILLAVSVAVFTGGLIWSAINS